MLATLNKAPRIFHRTILAVIISMARLPLIREIIFLVETYFLKRTLDATLTPGPTGKAMGHLFSNHEPKLSAKEIYREVFSPARFQQGYQSQIGQDLYLNRWFFKDRGPGFFVDVGAYDGLVGSNTFYFEKHLQWNGIAFEPNPPAFEALGANRSCDLIQGCAYNVDGQISFLGLSKSEKSNAKSRSPGSLVSMIFDPSHGGTMLGGIPRHMNQVRWVEWIRKAMKLDQTVETVPCYRLDTVLKDRGVKVVDYLSIDVEGAELEMLRGIDFEQVQVNVISIEHNHEFSEVYDLLTTSGFEYQGLLFFDEIFVHKRPRYSWDA